MKKFKEKYEGVRWGGGDEFSQVHSNEELNEKLFFFLMRNDMGGNVGIHKIKEHDSGRDTN